MKIAEIVFFILINYNYMRTILLNRQRDVQQ